MTFVLPYSGSRSRLLVLSWSPKMSSLRLKRQSRFSGGVVFWHYSSQLTITTQLICKTFIELNRTLQLNNCVRNESKPTPYICIKSLLSGQVLFGLRASADSRMNKKKGRRPNKQKERPTAE